MRAPFEIGVPSGKRKPGAPKNFWIWECSQELIVLLVASCHSLVFSILSKLGWLTRPKFGIATRLSIKSSTKISVNQKKIYIHT